ncbi:hypothetical protein B0F90DRAFT_324196 [Multifurca ochricompacta]|uniref:Uncharacterized protein n=1 Tax=Multifurca ochricompacta TaxID=376703 RepID=A0AAD4M512_9AGAM|nr:hypothetical protein B0F90DRAFT_324196 [Multifurca ochricompacta]
MPAGSPSFHATQMFHHSQRSVQGPCCNAINGLRYDISWGLQGLTVHFADCLVLLSFAGYCQVLGGPILFPSSFSMMVPPLLLRFVPRRYNAEYDPAPFAVSSFSPFLVVSVIPQTESRGRLHYCLYTPSSLSRHECTTTSVLYPSGHRRRKHATAWLHRARLRILCRVPFFFNFKDVTSIPSSWLLSAGMANIVFHRSYCYYRYPRQRNVVARVSHHGFGL